MSAHITVTCVEAQGNRRALKHRCSTRAPAFSVWSVCWARWWAIACLLVGGSTHAQEFPPRFIGPGDYIGTLTNGTVLRGSNVIAISESDYATAFLKEFSWGNPEAFAIETNIFLRMFGAQAGVSNGLLKFAQTEYRSKWHGRFAIEMANRVFSDAQLREALPDYADPAPRVGPGLERGRASLDLFASENREMPEAELRRRFEQHFRRGAPNVPAEELNHVVSNAILKWRQEALRSNVMGIRRSLFTSLVRGYAAQSNAVWTFERADWVAKHLYAQVAQHADVALPTLELTNRFLWPRASRYPCVFLVSDKAGMLGDLHRDLLAQRTAEALSARVAFLVGESPGRLGEWGTNMLKGLSLAVIDPSLKGVADLPRVFYRSGVEEGRFMASVARRSSLSPPPAELLFILLPPRDSLVEAMAKFSEKEWKDYLAAEGVIQALHARIRAQFTSINADLFPTVDDLRVWFNPESAAIPKIGQ